jgi:microcystin-dependent protein
MEPSYIGAIWFFGGNFAPVNFALCNGALTPISGNETLYAVLGTIYGGDGVSTFALPDLRGRAVVSQGQGPGLSNYNIGQSFGTETVGLTASNLPSHTHTVSAGTSATAQMPTSTMFINQVSSRTAASDFFSNATPTTTLAPTTIGAAGNSVPINILQPVLAVTCLITLFGIFPSQN